jgi:fructose-1-phosphate kinase PfkB-like protein
MMKRYQVEIEIETYATSQDHALSHALDVLVNNDAELKHHCNRIVAVVQETDDNGAPLMTRKAKRIVISRGAR